MEQHVLQNKWGKNGLSARPRKAMCAILSKAVRDPLENFQQGRNEMKMTLETLGHLNTTF